MPHWPAERFKIAGDRTAIELFVAAAQELDVSSRAWCNEYRQRESGATNSGCVVVVALSILRSGILDGSGLTDSVGCRRERGEAIMIAKERLRSADPFVLAGRTNTRRWLSSTENPATASEKI